MVDDGGLVRLSIRQREMLQRMAGYVTNPVAVKYRVWRGQEQQYNLGGIDIVLPPDHNLPFYQRRDPTYDLYAIDLLAALAAGPKHVTVIDVGANVGDTAATILASHPETSVISVEGSDAFVGYLRRNLAPHSDRARVIEGFVGPVGPSVVFTRQGSTGGFQAGAAGDSSEVTSWVTPSEILAMPDPGDLVVWKSDIDGFDIHVLVNHWEVIEKRCEVIWFEFDSPRTLGDRDDIARLVDLFAQTDRTLLVYDNLGRLMIHLQPGGIDGLLTLSQWLHQQYEGHVAVPYLDIWAITPEAFELMDAKGRE